MRTRSIVAALLGIICLCALLGMGQADALVIIHPPVTYVVDTNLDQNLTACTSAAADCSLRGAINAANAYQPTIGTNAIHFAIPGSGVPNVSIVNGNLPTITQTVVIDGTTQPAGRVAVSRNILGSAHDGILVTANGVTVKGLSVFGFSASGAYGIAVSGTGAVIRGDYLGTLDGITGGGGNYNGLWIKSASTGDSIGGSGSDTNVISANTNFGILLEGSTNTVQGNVIGANLAGVGALANGGGGVKVTGHDNTIAGGPAKNLISGNGASENSFGVSISGAGNKLLGDLIGTNKLGTGSIANYVGVILASGAVNTVVGGSTNADRNIISGNTRDGIVVQGGADSSAISGNFIGTNRDGDSEVTNGASGIVVAGSNNITIGGTAGTSPGGSCTGACNLISGNRFLADAGSDGDGIVIGYQATNARVLGNFIGTDVSGTSVIGNDLSGVAAAGPGTIIGGTTPEERNLISGNAVGPFGAAGVALGSNVTVEGNYIGTDTTGKVALGNGTQAGVISQEGTNDMIGGAAEGAGNVIVSQGYAAVSLEFGARDIVVQGNHIGTDPSGAIALGNAQSGVQVVEDSTSETIGGVNPGEGNVIANATNAGVDVESGTGTSILGNSIFGNARLGIDLGGNEVPLTNDSGDADPGPNDHQNFPVLTAAIAVGGTRVLGSLNSQPNEAYRVEFFSNPACDPSGNGEGQTFIGFENVNTDGGGDATIDATAGPASPGQVITATATDPNNNTSEFSACVTVVNQAPTPTPSPTPSPTPTPTPTSTPTGQTPTPAGSPTATPSGGATPTPAPPTLGDSNCDGSIDAGDVIADLSDLGGVPPGAPCPDSADVNCDNSVDADDALRIVLYLASVPLQQPPTCPEIGSAM